MKTNYIEDVVFDGSTKPGKVILNGTELSFETDDDARFVFHLLNLQKDSVVSMQKEMHTTRTFLYRAVNLLNNHLPNGEP